MPENNQFREMQAVFNFVRNTVRYVSDCDGVELVKTPEYMLAEIDRDGMTSGDCDDMALLLATMLKSIGIPVFFVLVRSPENIDGDYNHVYVRAIIHATGETITLDPIVKDMALGYEVDFNKREVFPV